MNIIVVGAGQAGYYLTKTLMSKRHKVTLVDWDLERVHKLESELGGSVMYCSGSSIDGLEKAGCRWADVIVAVTGDDEDNLVTCQIGKKYFNVPKAIARINNPKNMRIFSELGIKTVINGTLAFKEEIESYVARNYIKTLFSFNHEEMIIMESDISESSPVLNMKLKDIKLPYDSVIPVILRGKKC